MEKFLESMSAILEETVSADQILDNFITWDSFAFLSTMALAQSEYGKKITREELQQQLHVGDIYNLIVQV